MCIAFLYISLSMWLYLKFASTLPAVSEVGSSADFHLLMIFSADYYMIKLAQLFYIYDFYLVLFQDFYFLD